LNCSHTISFGWAFSGPSIFAALEGQLGLKSEARKAPVETLVIESIEKPSEN